jgi:hypothetical protein
MKIDHDDLIGYETLLSTEIIELLNINRATVNEYRIVKGLMDIDDSTLDEHELAMVG